MTARPTTSLDWGGAAVEPSSGEKATGYAPGDRPVAQWKNWELQTIDLWIKFLRDVFGDAAVRFGFTFDGDSAQFASGLKRALALKQESNTFLTSKLSAGFGGNLLSSLVYNDTLVAVGDSARIKTSADFGASWSAKTAGSSYAGNFRASLVWSNTPIIAGESGEIQTGSSDLNTWTRRNTTAGVTFRHIAGAGLNIVAVGGASTGGSIYRSTNAGVTWAGASTTVGAGFGFFSIAAMGNSTFVAVGSGGTATRANHMWRSSDGGATFVAVDLSGVLLVSTERVEQVVYHANLGFVGLVKDNATLTYTCVIVSTDGVTWNKKGVAAFTSLALDTDVFRFVSTSGGLMLLSPTAPGISAVSVDGETWATLPTLQAGLGGTTISAVMLRYGIYDTYLLCRSTGTELAVGGPFAT